MKKLLVWMAVSFLGGVSAWAAKHTYQVTGPVEEVSDSSIIVKKGSDHWEIARDPSTQVEGEVKPGEKVTVEYTMTATHIQAKAAKAAKNKKK